MLMALPAQTKLNDTYVLEAVLGQAGPFNIVYQAKNLETDSPVVIREYFPSAIAERSEADGSVVATDEKLFAFGQKQFLMEGAVLRKLDHPNIISEMEAFEANGTAYRVAEHPKGATLEVVLNRRTKPLPRTAAFRVVQGLLSGLHAAHGKGMIHGGVSPASIFLNKEGRPMLFSFRISRILLANEMGTVAGQPTPFKAPEQLQPRGKQGPWTDVYGAAATLTYLLTGSPLPELQDRDNAVDEYFAETSLPAPFQDVLIEALRRDPARRPRSVASFKKRLVEAVQAVQESEARRQAPPEPPKAPVEETPPAEPSPPRLEVSRPSELPAPEPEKQEAPQEAPSEEIKNRSTPEADGLEQSVRQQKVPAPSAAPEESAGELPSGAEEKEPEDVAESPAKTEKSAEETAASEEDIDQEKTSEEAAEPTPAPGERAADRSPEPRRGSSKVVWLASLGLVLVGLAVGIGYLWYSPVAFGTEGRPAPGFELLKAKGDSLFEAGNFSQATTFYQQALMADPDDEHVSERLTEAEERIYEEQESQFDVHLEQGNELMDEAASELEAGNPSEAMGLFDEASRAYLQALPFRPDDPELMDRLDAASRGLNESYLAYEQDGEVEEEDAEEVSEELFESHLEEAQERLAADDFAGATRRVENALELRPDDAEAQELLEQVQARQAEQAETEAFDEHIARAEAMLEEERYAEAVVQLEDALELRPNDPALRARIAEVETLRDEQREQEQQYSYYRAQGDLLFSEERYEEAIQSYQNALEYTSGDEYVEEQLRLSEEQVAARQAEERRASLRHGDVYVVADEPPELVGSLPELYSNIEYPQRAQDRGVQGRVYVQFVVDERGAVQRPEVVRGIGHGCDEEAVRVIQEAEFEPGRVDGEPVKAQHTLMIEFRLDAGEDD